MAKALADKKGLEPPFPSSPQRPPQFVFHFYLGGNLKATHNFYAAYAARRFIDEVTKEDRRIWLDENSFKVNTALGELEVVLKGVMELDALVDFDLKPTEEAWVLPQPYDDYASVLRGEREPQEEREAPQRKSRRQRQRKERKAPQQRAQRPDGHVSVSDIASELGILPREARARLRKLGLKKPDHGWAWPKNEAKKVAKQIKEAK